MKYMTKQFGTGDQVWTDCELLFNAMIWDTGTRMWGASKALTAIMRRPKKESDLTWDTVELLIPGAQFTVWSRKDGTPFPVLFKQQEIEQDPDDLCPEGYVTKQLWINLFSGIERQREESKYQ
jgi:hypothetical protein